MRSAGAALAFASVVASGWAADPVDFARSIRPILSDNCFRCHGPDEKARAGELRLDRRDDALADRDGAPAVAPGEPDRSELVRRVASDDPDERMPPPETGKTLTGEQISLIRRWIEQGAAWSEHWAFVAPRQAAPPLRRDSPAEGGGEFARFPRNPVDPFVFDRLDREGLAPSPEAAPNQLLRRLTLDLTGLPPTTGELDRFLADLAPDRLERLLDRLLASPSYGEHAAASWLDAARYADTNGYQNDGVRTMWPWRDWLIDALNRNMPFDQFTVEQTAGDLLPDAGVEERIATGFHRNHPLNGEGGRIPEESRVEYVFDRVETLGAVWLGLTIGCARCHDHKYDPISQREYYRLFAYFNSIAEEGGVDRGGNAVPVVRAPTRSQERRRDELLAEIQRMDAALAEPATPSPTTPSAGENPLVDILQRAAQRLDLERRRRDAKAQLAKLESSAPETMVLEDRAEPRPTHLLVRGAYDKPDASEPLAPGTPAVLPPPPADAPPNRAALARWLVDPANPLTARVTVNRMWQNLFGEGLVRTPEDFGAQGELPTHPELLDWLAVEFQQTGWDVKGMLRLLASSAAYRQSSAATPQLLERDPKNRLGARGPRHRLSSLALRDQSLALAGLLVDEMGGPGVNPYQPDDVWTDFSLGKIQYRRDKGAALYRRSVYVFWRRSVGPTMFFDASNRQVCEVRPRLTNTPLHALTMMNDPAQVEAARVWAERLLREEGPGPRERLRAAFRAATARPPTEAELELLLASWNRSRAAFAADTEAAAQWTGVGDSPPDPSLDRVELAACAATLSVILNLDEVQTKE